MIRTLFLALMLTVQALPAFAVNPDEVLADPALEARARALSSQLRCMVCQNQSIDDSNAELAKDLRVLLRERLKSGASDQEVLDYLVSRYGEFVLLKPEFSARNLLLWGLPVILLGIGGVAIAVQVSRRRGQAVGRELSPEEQEKLDALLKN